MRMIFRTILCSFLVVGYAAAAQAHASLVNASPSAGSTMGTAPDQVILTFSEKLVAAFSKLTVTDASGGEVSQGGAQVNQATMQVGLKPLGPGTYVVNWRAISADTHKIEGSFTFRVAP